MKKILVMMVCIAMAVVSRAEDRFWGFSLTPQKQVPSIGDNVKGIRLGIYGEHYDVSGLDICLGFAQVDHDLKGEFFNLRKYCRRACDRRPGDDFQEQCGR